jgi:CHASE3 domain sensor protein
MEAVAASVRGFALTGRESYVTSYRAARLSAEQHTEAIRNLSADNPEQQRRLADLEQLTAVRLERGEMVIGLRRSQGLEAAADAVRSGPGQKITDDLQLLARGLQDEERRLLERRNADALRRFEQTKAILIFGTFLGLLITGAAGWTVQRNGSRRALAEAAFSHSEEQYRMLLDGIQDYAIFMINPQGEVVSWNAGAERIEGYSADEIIGTKTTACVCGRTARASWRASPSPRCVTRPESSWGFPTSVMFSAKAKKRRRSIAV